jgi:hypothetical protein
VYSGRDSPPCLLSPSEFTNRILCGDALRFMKRMPDACVNPAVTSPPYNLKNSTGNGMKDGRSGKWANPALVNGYSHHPDDLPHHEYVAWQRTALSEMMRLLRDDGAVFYNHKWRVQNGLLQDRQDIVAGFPVRQVIVWKRKGGINFNPGYFLPTYEVIHLIAKPKSAMDTPRPSGRVPRYKPAVPTSTACPNCREGTAVGVRSDGFYTRFWFRRRGCGWACWRPPAPWACSRGDGATIWSASRLSVSCFHCGHRVKPAAIPPSNFAGRRDGVSALAHLPDDDIRSALAGRQVLQKLDKS